MSLFKDTPLLCHFVHHNIGAETFSGPHALELFNNKIPVIRRHISVLETDLQEITAKLKLPLPIFCNQWGRHSSTQFYYKEMHIALSVDSDDSSLLCQGDPESIDKFIEFVRTVLTENTADNKDPGEVYALIYKDNHLKCSRIGSISSPLCRENYSTDTLEAYDFTVKELATDTPSGRITLLDGIPGTGKTFMLRGLISEVSKAAFVIIPPNMFEHVGDPGLLTTMLEKRDEDDWPIIMVLEDADRILAKRTEKNLDILFSALNLGDGILGDMCNTRIIATTNVAAENLDPAILRDGRLSRHITLPILAFEAANTILERLVEKEAAMPENREYALCEVYKYARSLGWNPPSKKKIATPIPHSYLD